MNNSLLRYRLLNAPSRIDGTGCYAGQSIPARKKIGDIAGEIIPLREARRRVKHQQRAAMVEFGDGYALDASVQPNALRYVNHSCKPNAYMRCCFQKVEIYALRRIRKGEEITCNYGETHHDGKLPCNCGAPGCRGRL